MEDFSFQPPTRWGTSLFAIWSLLSVEGSLPRGKAITGRGNNSCCMKLVTRMFFHPAFFRIFAVKITALYSHLEKRVIEWVCCIFIWFILKNFPVCNFLYASYNNNRSLCFTSWSVRFDHQNIGEETWWVLLHFVPSVYSSVIRLNDDGSSYSIEKLQNSSPSSSRAEINGHRSRQMYARTDTTLPYSALQMWICQSAFSNWPTRTTCTKKACGCAVDTAASSCSSTSIVVGFFHRCLGLWYIEGTNTTCHGSSFPLLGLLRRPISILSFLYAC